MNVFVAFAAFTVFSWGGSKGISTNFLDRIGVDTVNCMLPITGPITPKAEARIAAITDGGRNICIRYENLRRWTREKRGPVDWDRVRRETAEDLGRFAANPRWTMTLANSEVYPSNPLDAPSFDNGIVARARAAIGMEPDFGAKLHDGLFEPTNRAAFAGMRGVIGHGNALLETLRWFREEGMPSLEFLRIVRDEVHRMKPGNIVWTEPLLGGIAGSCDMTADWLYEYSEFLTLGSLRSMAVGPRVAEKPFMPTLTAYYYPAQFGEHPTAKDKDGNPLKVRMSQSPDELEIKSYLAVGAAKAGALSLFHFDTWEQGEIETRQYLADASTPITTVAEVGAADRYGKFLKSRLLPLAETFKSAENARAPLAVYVPGPVGVCGGWLFGLHHYKRMIFDTFGKKGIPYDVIGDSEVCDTKVLGRYKYLFMPMCNVMYAECDAAIKAAAEKGLVVVLDAHGKLFKDRYPNSEFHSEILYKHIWNAPDVTYVPLRAWADSKRDELRALSRAWSSGDAGESFTFVKAAKDAAYVIVVNNKRREGGGILTDFKKTKTVKMPDDYRPYGAPQRITTHIRARADCVVEEVMPEGTPLAAVRRGGEWIIEGDYAPAQGRVFRVSRTTSAQYCGMLRVMWNDRGKKR